MHRSCCKAAILAALPLLLALVFPVRGQETDAAKTPAPAENHTGQALQIMGRVFKYQNRDTSGTFELIIDKNGDPEDLKAIGDIVLTSEDFELFCHDLEYHHATGEMIARKWADKQVKLIQKGATAWTDKMFYLAEYNRTELLGKAKVLQNGPKDTTEVYGDLIVRTENPDGTSWINVQKKPVMKHYPHTADTDTPTSGAAALDPAGAASTAMAGVSSGLGRNIVLRADPVHGVFDMTIDTAGVVTKFQAYRGVILKSDKLDLDCDQLDLLENGDQLEATGFPVLIRQGNVNADCHRFQYQASTKKSVLTGKPAPRIFQTEDKRKIKMSAPKIVLTENESGDVSIDLIGLDLQQHEKTQELPQFEIEQQQEPADSTNSINSPVRLLQGEE